MRLWRHGAAARPHRLALELICLDLRSAAVAAAEMVAGAFAGAALPLLPLPLPALPLPLLAAVGAVGALISTQRAVAAEKTKARAEPPREPPWNDAAPQRDRENGVRKRA